METKINNILPTDKISAPADSSQQNTSDLNSSTQLNDRPNPQRFIFNGKGDKKKDTYPMIVKLPENILAADKFKKKNLIQLKRQLQVTFDDTIMPFTIKDNVINITLTDSFKSLDKKDYKSLEVTVMVSYIPGNNKIRSSTAKGVVINTNRLISEELYRSMFWFYKEPPENEDLQKEAEMISAFETGIEVPEMGVRANKPYHLKTKLKLNLNTAGAEVLSNTIQCYIHGAFCPRDKLIVDKDFRNKQFIFLMKRSSEHARNGIYKFLFEITESYLETCRHENDFQDGILQLLDFLYAFGEMGHKDFIDIYKKVFSEKDDKPIFLKFQREENDTPKNIFISISAGDVITEVDELATQVSNAILMQPDYSKEPLIRLESPDINEDVKPQERVETLSPLSIQQLIEDKIKSLSEQKNSEKKLSEENTPANLRLKLDHKLRKTVHSLVSTQEQKKENERDTIYKTISDYLKEFEQLLNQFKRKNDVDNYLEIIKTAQKKSLQSRWYLDGTFKPTVACQEITQPTISDEIKQYFATLDELYTQAKEKEDITALLNEQENCKRYLEQLKNKIRNFNEHLNNLKEDAEAVEKARASSALKSPGKKAQKTEEHQRAMEQKRHAKLLEQRQLAQRTEEEKRLKELRRESRRKEIQQQQIVGAKLGSKHPVKNTSPSLLFFGNTGVLKSSTNKEEKQNNSVANKSSQKANYLDYALRHYIAIKHILAFYDSNLNEQKKGGYDHELSKLLSEMVHYALLYNMTRCFQALTIYKLKGGDPSKEIDQYSIEDFRNMIIHHGALEAKHEDTLLTARMLSEGLSDKFLKIRKPYLMESALSSSQINDILATKKLTNDPLYADKCYSPLIEDTPLYKTLSKFHEAKVTNDMDFYAVKKKIENQVLPKILAFFDKIKKSHAQAPEQKSLDNFYEFFLIHCQAIKSLLAICGELCDVEKCNKNIEAAANLKTSLNIPCDDELTNFSQFLLDCRKVRNKIGHYFTPEESCDVSLEKLYDLCYQVEKLTKKKTSLAEILQTKRTKDFLPAHEEGSPSAISSGKQKISLAEILATKGVKEFVPGNEQSSPSAISPEKQKISLAEIVATKGVKEFVPGNEQDPPSATSPAL